MISDELKSKMINEALEARKNAYAPYSGFSVGAALLAKNGKIYAGSNFENVSFGAGVCAERVALGHALSFGEREFEAVCVCGKDSNITPCGICRQSLSEFGDIEVICCNYDGTQIKSYMLHELLPFAFSSID